MHKTTQEASKAKPPTVQCIICDKQPEIHNNDKEKSKHLKELMHKQYSILLEKFRSQDSKAARPAAKDLEATKDHKQHKCVLCDKTWAVHDDETKHTPLYHLKDNPDHKIGVENLWKGLQSRLSEASFKDKDTVPRGSDAFFTPPLVRKST